MCLACSSRPCDWAVSWQQPADCNICEMLFAHTDVLLFLSWEDAAACSHFHQAEWYWLSSLQSHIFLWWCDPISRVSTDGRVRAVLRCVMCETLSLGNSLSLLELLSIGIDFICVHCIVLRLIILTPAPPPPSQKQDVPRGGRSWGWDYDKHCWRGFPWVGSIFLHARTLFFKMQSDMLFGKTLSQQVQHPCKTFQYWQDKHPK